MDAVDDIRYRSGHTNTTGGLKVAREQVFNSQGDRPEADNLLILISDGTPTKDVDDLIPLARAMKSRDNIRIIGVGVSDAVNVTTFQMIVSDPFSSHYFGVDDFDELQSIIGALIAQACRTMPPPTAPIPTSSPAPRK